MNITFTHEISVEHYNRLRISVGWTPLLEACAHKGLENTAFLIVALVDNKPVGMARVITDYGYVYYIADVIVHPDYQGKGIGRQIFTKVMEFAEGGVVPGQFRQVLLMAAKGKDGFYKKFGFRERPNDYEGPGMICNVH